jgi:hypothetical protein
LTKIKITGFSSSGIPGLTRVTNASAVASQGFMPVTCNAIITKAFILTDLGRSFLTTAAAKIPQIYGTLKTKAGFTDISWVGLATSAADTFGTITIMLFKLRWFNFATTTTTGNPVSFLPELINTIFTKVQRL